MEIREIEEDWITTVEASNLSKYHLDHLRRLLRNGDIQGKKWGNTWMVSRMSLVTYLRKMESKGARRGPKIS
jgi:hypothetical protein